MEQGGILKLAEAMVVAQAKALMEAQGEAGTACRSCLLPVLVALAVVPVGKGKLVQMAVLAEGRRTGMLVRWVRLAAFDGNWFFQSPDCWWSYSCPA